MMTIAYYTVVIPPAPAYGPVPTKWHDNDRTLSRGAFPSKEKAHAWAAEHIPGHTYTVRGEPEEG